MSDDRPPKATSGGFALIGFVAGVLTVVIIALILGR